MSFPHPAPALPVMARHSSNVTQVVSLSSFNKSDFVEVLLIISNPGPVTLLGYYVLFLSFAVPFLPLSFLCAFSFPLCLRVSGLAAPCSVSHSLLLYIFFFSPVLFVQFFLFINLIYLLVMWSSLSFSLPISFYFIFFSFVSFFFSFQLYLSNIFLLFLYFPFFSPPICLLCIVFHLYPVSSATPPCSYLSIYFSVRMHCLLPSSQAVLVHYSACCLDVISMQMASGTQMDQVLSAERERERETRNERDLSAERVQGSERLPFF